MPAPLLSTPLEILLQMFQNADNIDVVRLGMVGDNVNLCFYE